MRTKLLILTGLLLIFTFALASVAQAKTNKYTFNDVVIGEQIVEIEAGVKSNNKGDYSTCSYYSDGYADYLGFYEEAVKAGDTAEEVLTFCVNNFENRDYE